MSSESSDLLSLALPNHPIIKSIIPIYLKSEMANKKIMEKIT